MLRTWSAIMAVLLVADLAQAQTLPPEVLPEPMPVAPANKDRLPLARVDAPVIPLAQVAAPIVLGQPAPVDSTEHSGSCCKRDVGCLERICLFFTYRAKELTSCKELCQPFSPQPPLYVYFLHNPQPIEGPGETYPPKKLNCWSSDCSAGLHMFALPSSQNAGFDH